ncbi:MAG: metallophosphoesterase family protein, partial [Actinomycetota bacterium]
MRRHRVLVTVPEPGETYEYQAVSDEGVGAWQPFQTRPPKPAPFQFAVVGDVGEGSRGERAVADIIQREAPEFTVAVGDLGYPLSDELTLSERFFAPFERYAAGHVIWHVFGNHDVKADHGRPLAMASAAPDNGPEGLPPGRNYSFDYGDAHFTVIDSNEDGHTLRTRTQPWLERDLAATKSRWKFVFLHHPPFSSGRHGCSKKVQRALVPTFQRMKVNLVFAGHDHDYERFRPIDGVTYVVSGDGGASLYRFEKSHAASVRRANRRHGLTMVSV